MKKFFKNWWEVIVFAAIMIILRVFFISPIVVDGHSMDPTLINGERMIMVRHLSINRFDIVVSEEPGQPGKNIIKRVIGMPGDTITFDNDQLIINGKKYDEPYLLEYQTQWAKDRLQETYSFNSYFQEIAKTANAFTQLEDRTATFTIEVPDGHYFLMGDDRLISKDSRDPSVGPVPASDIRGEAKIAFWPLNRIRLF
ncbi:MAG: signal peptidase I [Streptococcaceae bacterium]|jgi:signal peptidase I|nr:signal peptidase I [Streptococcaceae bacterium]